MYELLPDVVASETDLIIKKEITVIVTEQIKTVRQYFKPKSVTEEIAVCSCSSKVEALERELVESNSNTRILAEKLESCHQFHFVRKVLSVMRWLGSTLECQI